MTALIVIAVIIAVFALILLIPISFRVFFKYSDDGINSTVSLKYGIIKILNIKIPSDKVEKKAKKPKKEKLEKKKPSNMKVLPKFLMENVKEIKKLIATVLNRLLRKTLKVKKLYVNSELGFDDAMNTGLIYGAVSGVIYNIAGLMDRKMQLEKHDIALKPDFETPHIFAEVEIVINTNVLNVILLAAVALMRALPLYKKLKKMIGENNNGKSD